MNRLYSLLSWIIIFINVPGCYPAYAQNHVHKEHHSDVPVDRLEWINRRYDQEWNHWRESMFDLDIHENMLIGEIGAGNGEFTHLLSGKVGHNGHVYANEIDPGKIQDIKDLINEENVQNMTLITGSEDDALFPVNDLDMAIMVEVYHHLAHPAVFVKNLKQYLKEDGQLVIIEPDVNQPGGTLDGCYSDPESTKLLLLDSGYRNINVRYRKVLDLEFYILRAYCPSNQ